MKRLLSLLLLCAPILASAQTYNQFACGGDLSGAGCTWNSQIIGNGAVTLAKQANLPAYTIQGNNTSSSATPLSLATLDVSQLIGSQLVAVASSKNDGNQTLTGAATFDGTALITGMRVLVAAQTTSRDNGLYIVNTAGAWSRDPAFPSGYTLPAQCIVSVFLRNGTLYGGTSFKLTTNAAITIGTSNEQWTQVFPPLATSSIRGNVTVSGTPTIVPSYTGILNNVATTANDCATFSDTNGSIQDGQTGHQGPCAITDSTWHHLFPNSTGTTAASAGSIGCTPSDSRGCVTGLVAATALTITFANAFGYVPSCHLSGSAALSAVTTTPLATSVAFGFAAFTGTVYYLCL